MWACACWDMTSCSAGGMIWSAVPIRDQDGIVFHAGTPDGSEIGLCRQGALGRGRRAPSAADNPLAKQLGNRLGLTYRSTSLAGPPEYGAKLKTVGGLAADA